MYLILSVCNNSSFRTSPNAASHKHLARIRSAVEVADFNQDWGGDPGQYRTSGCWDRGVTSDIVVEVMVDALPVISPQSGQQFECISVIVVSTAFFDRVTGDH